MKANPFGTLLQKAIYRYNLAKFYGQPFYKCVQTFFSFKEKKKEGSVRNENLGR